jgi:hypothetical protein
MTISSSAEATPANTLLGREGFAVLFATELTTTGDRPEVDAWQ